MKHSKAVLSLLFTICVCFQLLAQDKKGQERWEETIKNFEKSDQQNPPKEGVILFTGSSSVVMYEDLEKDFPNHNVLNRGFGGSQFSDLIYYTNRVIYPYKPSKIFIYEGDNDIAEGKLPKDVLAEAIELRKEIDKKLPGVPVVFISPKPSVARWGIKDKYEEVNKGLKAYADKTKNTMFADVWTAMLDENGKVYDHIFIEDNLHMNPEGYAIWKRVLEPYMDNTRKD